MLKVQSKKKKKKSLLLRKRTLSNGLNFLFVSSFLVKKLKRETFFFIFFCTKRSSLTNKSREKGLFTMIDKYERENLFLSVKLENRRNAICTWDRDEYAQKRREKKGVVFGRWEIKIKNAKPRWRRWALIYNRHSPYQFNFPF